MTGSREGVFAAYHPAFILLFFIFILLITMFTSNPFIHLSALLGGVCFCAVLEGMGALIKSFLYTVPFFLLVTVTNPLFSHNGATPLFFMGGNPVTLEALLCGADIGLMLFAVIYWCRCMSRVMTSEKLLFLFGKAAPALSLVLSMTLRFLPLFLRQYKKAAEAQKTLGVRREGLRDKVKGALQTFSAVVTWSMEHAMETGASMKARGYGLKGRGHFSLFRLTRRDVVMLLTDAVLMGITLFGIGCKAVDFYFYPEITKGLPSPVGIMTYTAFAALLMLPVIMEGKEALLWRYYRSKI